LRVRGTKRLGTVSLVAMGGGIATLGPSSTRAVPEALEAAATRFYGGVSRIRRSRGGAGMSPIGRGGFSPAREGLTMADAGTSMGGKGTVVADELRLLVERVERLEEEKKAIADDVKDVYAEAKARGYDTKAVRTIVRLRKMETHVRQEAEAILDTYMAALGMV
jgi:uncharacterized protein (UPF0335 family)